jgi:hypothetical protein
MKQKGSNGVLEMNSTIHQLDSCAIAEYRIQQPKSTHPSQGHVRIHLHRPHSELQNTP